MFKPIIAAAILSVLALPALAKEFQLPAANPAVSVTLPDSWEPEDIDKGVQATSPDNEAYIAMETATAASVEALVKEAVDFLRTNKVTLDVATQKRQDATINGIPVTIFRWEGTDDDGPTRVTLAVFGITNNLAMLLTAWATPDSETKYSKDLTATLQSIRRLQ